MNAEFKKYYLHNPKEFFSLFKKTFKMAKKAKKIDGSDKISQAFAEKIMLAVTGVNDCVYCSYRHSGAALEKGIDRDEIDLLLKGDFGKVAEEEKVALLYAQHWADSRGDPADKARLKMIDCYGEKKTEYIEVILNMINMGNLVSNTHEAFKNRVRPAHGRVSFYLTCLLCSPIASRIKRDAVKKAGSAL